MINNLKKMNTTIKYTAMYTFFVLLQLLACIINYHSFLPLITFLVTTAFLLYYMKNLDILFYYYIILLLNNSLLESRVPFTSSTLMGIVKWMIIGIFAYLVYKNRQTIKNQNILPWIFCIGWIFYLIINSILNNVGIKTSMYLPFIIMFASQMLAMGKKKLNKSLLFATILSTSMIMLFTGYVELVLEQTFFYSLWTEAERYRYGIIRVGSTVGDPNFLCLNLIFFLFIMNSKSIREQFNLKFIKVLSTLIIVLVILTFSRTGLLTLVCCCFLKYINIKKINLKKFIRYLVPGLILIAIALVWSFYNLDFNSFLARSNILVKSFSLIMEKPLFGWGNNAFYNMSSALIGNQRSTMNEYIGQLVNYGVVGLSFYITYFILCIKKVNLLISKEDRLHVLLALISYCIMSFTLDTIFKPLIWIIPPLIIVLMNNEEYKEIKEI